MFLRFKAHYNQPNLDGNRSIIPLSLPYQTFLSLIETCGMGSVSLCCEGFLPPSIAPILQVPNTLLQSGCNYTCSNNTSSSTSAPFYRTLDMPHVPTTTSRSVPPYHCFQGKHTPNIISPNVSQT